MSTIQKEKEQIKAILDKFTFVKWDRVIEDNFIICIYGWINREKDSYKDFVLLEFARNMYSELIVQNCTTSSAKYSKEINKLCGFQEEEHTDCIRIKDYLNTNLK